jgi:MerR family transcriptional regulator/heat shock protein HspR
VTRLVRIGELLADGLNLAGVARVLELEESVRRLRAANDRLRER